jgi:hypothetical protein
MVITLNYSYTMSDEEAALLDLYMDRYNKHTYFEILGVKCTINSYRINVYQQHRAYEFNIQQVREVI